MKKVNLIIILLLTLIITSCNDNEETHTGDECIGENYEITFDRYIKKLRTTPPNIFGAIRNYDYSYNEYNLLEKKEEYTFDYGHERFFNYQCNNNLSERSSDFSNSTHSYAYNSENQLIAFNSPHYQDFDYQLTYNANSISVVGTINSIENTEITLELNSSNLITKVLRAANYSVFEYDVNGNLVTAKDFNLNNELLKAYEITYDQNPNPFYGQLSSVYLERFIHYFNTSAFWGIDVFFRFDNFNFPYLKNNPVLLKDVKCTSCYSDILKREYTYDSQNYPKKIVESYVGAPAIIYNLEYR